MSEATPGIRQVPLPEFAECVRLLLAALTGNGLKAEQLTSLLDQAIHFRCAQCGLELTSDDLLPFAASAVPAEEDNQKTSRLRLGYCARNGCPSRYYQFVYLPHPDVDWTAVFAESAQAAEQQRMAEIPEAKAGKWSLRASYLGFLLRLLAGTALILVLLLARQWQIGGRIPFLREPAKYTIEPAAMHAAGLCPLGDKCPYHSARTKATNNIDINTHLVGGTTEVYVINTSQHK